mmetsp:Transcript_22452/g.31211  ORF Transcript_22452/g.31211 Transcript_22452/m.31211 type:complete len:510 (+) Transcript_22452:58-1587(+)|eukprot:CAMPEP_0196581770 /NCGR_PEP_ID=MMETSP1081-20130531/35492_1 /TAXON_ID=36882 /ORGANISM="Pyramimonas amylifera, Strain CCMP720" /LENGTH=509 /DNA_ID=CAMNT_0041902117 /DNA_START=47 /DNA_END=1576 /DNA_ORIENTATION=-
MLPTFHGAPKSQKKSSFLNNSSFYRRAPRDAAPAAKAGYQKIGMRSDAYEKLGKGHNDYGRVNLHSVLANKKVWGLVACVLLAGAWFGLSAPGGWFGGDDTYAVVFDAGSTGSRVHVFKFRGSGANIDLRMEVFEALKPGFRSFASSPEDAAESLEPLLEKVREHVPLHKRSTTPMTLRATAGIRLLPEGAEAAQAIMAAVGAKLRKEGLYMEEDYVSILGGDMEGVFGWLSVNYLKGTLGKTWDQTLAMLDMGGGSMQMAYAVSEEVAAEAPEGYIRKINAGGALYHLYIKSYSGYGIMAGRAHILQTTAEVPEGTHPCVPLGYEGGCTEKCYGLPPGEGYQAKARVDGAIWGNCLGVATMALDKEKKCAKEGECSFAGEWAPRLMVPVYAMSYFYERPAQAKAITPLSEDAQVAMKPKALAEVGPTVCSTPNDEIGKKYPDSEEDHRTYLCLDVAFQYAILTKGFGISPDDEIQLVSKIPYNGQGVEAAWPLGDALEVLGDLNKKAL